MPSWVLLLLPIAFASRLLVLLDDGNIEKSHRGLFDYLRAENHTLSFLMADSENLMISKYGEYLYDAILFMSPSIHGNLLIQILEATRI